jgi:hypothetical protein
MRIAFGVGVYLWDHTEVNYVHNHGFSFAANLWSVHQNTVQTLRASIRWVALDTAITSTADYYERQKTDLGSALEI